MNAVVSWHLKNNMITSKVPSHCAVDIFTCTIPLYGNAWERGFI